MKFYLLSFAILVGCASHKDDDDKLFEGEQFELTPRIDWYGHDIPDGGWGDASSVIFVDDASASSSEL